MSKTPSDDPTTEAKTRRHQAARHYEAFLETFGAMPKVDRVAAGRRVAEMMDDWTRAAREPIPSMSLFEAPRDADWVALGGVPFHSMCEHHLLPFFGHLDIAFLPGAVVPGFSSIVRLVEHICRRPQLQEGLVVDIADALEKALKPRGVLIRLSARQLCMEMRGRGVGVQCISVAARGVCREADGRQAALDAIDAQEGGGPLTEAPSLEGPPVVLVGAGAAGISCALWLKDYGIPFVWLDKNGQCGGTLRHVYGPVHNYAGLRSTNGLEFVEQLETQLSHMELAPTRSVLERLELPTRHVVVDGQSRRAGFVVLATGVVPRPLKNPGAEGLGARAFYSSNQLSKHVDGKRVVTVGGGDGALEGSLILAQRGAARVTILHRSEFTARPEFVERARQHPNVELRAGAYVQAFDTQGPSIQVQTDRDGHQELLDADYVLVKIGYAPVLPEIRGAFTSHSGYPATDEAWRLMGADWVYVVGDASSRQHQTLAHAVAEGASVARDIAQRMGLM